MDAFFRPGIDTLFPPSTFNGFEMGSLAETPILIDGKQDKENYLPHLPTAPVSGRPTQTPVLMRSPPFWTTIEKLPNYV